MWFLPGGAQNDHRQPMPLAGQGEGRRHDVFLGVQILRGLAAIVVLLQHNSFIMAERFSDSSLRFESGQCGVDIFFAISGFVMVVVTADSWGHADTARSFLVRRLIRVVPLYWFFTTIKVFLLLALPALALATVLTPWHVISSFLFIPADFSAPLVQVGWTLCYEMFFYMLFAGVLFMRVRQPVIWLSGLLTALVVAGIFRTDSWLSLTKLMDPVLIEFVFGMLIGAATVKSRLLPPGIALGLAIVCLAALLLSNGLGNDARSIRLFVWGIPTALLLASIVSLEGWFRRWPAKWLIALGAWSYSLYLSHGFVVDFAWVVAAKLHLGRGLPTYIVYASTFGAAIAVAYVIHRLIEAPVTRALNRTYDRVANRKKTFAARLAKYTMPRPVGLS
jgi:exopolysaccharide production protein ExoZ